MYRLVLLVLAAVAACTPDTGIVRPPPAVTDTSASVHHLDQGWTDAERSTFSSTRQGSYLMPLPWFLALQRTDAHTPFAADQLQRFGYLAPDDASQLPVGFVRDGTPSDPYVGMTCAACHTGQLRIQGVVWRIEGGRAHADFQSFLTQLGAAASATLADPARFASFASAVLGQQATKAQSAALHQQLADWTTRFNTFMAASLPDPAWGPGRLDAFGMIFNRVSGLDLQYPPNVTKADAPVRYPFIWDAPRQDHTQWTGAAPNGTYLRGLARNTGEVFGVFGRFKPVPIPIHTAVYNNDVNLSGLQAIEELVVSLRSPRWPQTGLPLDDAKVSRGAVLFQSQCASCHAVQPSPLVQKAWATPVVDVGTDRRTFDRAQQTGSPRALKGTREPIIVGPALTDPSAKLDILANAVVGSLVHGALQLDPAIRRAINQDFAEGRLPEAGTVTSGATPGDAAANVQQATKDLYKTPRQVPGAAYEARVLTGIWAVGPYLHNGSVPTLYDLLKPASERPTSFAVGHEDFDPVRVGLQTQAAPGRAMFVVDPSHGNGNGGHEYGTALPDEDRWALVEYLKTL